MVAKSNKEKGYCGMQYPFCLFLQLFQSHSGGILLRTLFAGAAALTNHSAIERHFHKELLIMVGATFAHQRIGEHLVLLLLHQSCSAVL